MTQEKTVTRLSFGLVIGVVIIKSITAVFVQSISFLAELSDAVLDILQVGITFLALKLSRRPPDADHMFGHTKINSLAGFIESLLIIGLYGGIGYTSIKKLVYEPNYTTENGWLGSISLIIIMIGVLITSKKIEKIGIETNNQVIIAQGLNFRSDFLRNIAVMIGLAVSYIWEIGWIDLILALIVSIYTIYEGLKVLKESTNELLDANAFAEDFIQEIRKNLETIPHVLNIDNIAIRTVGKRLEAILEIAVPPEIQTEKYEQLTVQVKEVFRSHFPKMDVNLNVQINIETILSKSRDSYDIFEWLRSIELNDYDLTDLHNIKIDQFPNEIIIQYHIRVDPDYTIDQAHQNANQLEFYIDSMIQNIYPEKKVQVISHLETINPISNHKQFPETTSAIKDMKIFAKELFVKYNDLAHLQSLKTIDQSMGVNLILVIQFNPTMLLREVEKIMDDIENRLYQSRFEIINVLIHPEPL